MPKSKSREETSTASQMRREIIAWFFDHNKKGRAPKGIKDVCSAIKEAYGYKSTVVKEHLTYLVDLQYIKKEIEQRTIRTGATVRDQPKVLYRIAAKGIEYMEGKSEFSDRDRYPGINVTATGGSVVVLGDGNVVNSTYQPLYQELDRMRQAVADTSELNDSSKLEATVYIDTIKAQLALSKPDKSIIEKSWAAVSGICTVATLAGYAQTIGNMLSNLF